VNAVLRFITRPWAGVRHARTELAKSEQDRPRVRELGADLHRIDQENHIAQRLHRGMRGGTE
jgi:hypothetical protein